MKKFRRKVLDMLMSNNSGSSLRQQLLDGAPFRSSLLYTAVPQFAASGTTGTFTRATTSTWQNNDGYQVTGVAGEIGFVGARRVRNHTQTTSEDFSNAAWTKSNTTVIANQATAPNGTLTADLLQPGSSGTDRAIYQNGLVSSVVGNKMILEIYAKYAGIQWLWFGTLGGGTGPTSVVASFDIQNGVVGQTGSYFSSSAIEDIGDGWYRCSAIATLSVAPLYPVYGLADADGSTTVTASGSNGIYLWGAQVEDVTAQTTQTAGEYVSVGVPSDWAGPELVTNGTFDTDSDWNKEVAQITISGGTAVFTACAADKSLYKTSFGFSPSQNYICSFDIPSISAGGVYLSCAGVVVSGVFTTAGTKIVTFTTAASLANDNFNIISSGASTTCTVDNVSLKPAIYHGSFVDGVKCFPTDLAGNALPTSYTYDAVSLNGVAGTYVSTSDSVAASVTGSSRFEWVGSIYDYNMTNTLLSKWNVGSYLLRISAAKKVLFNANGTNSVSITSTASVPFNNGDDNIGVKVEVVADNGAGGSTTSIYTTIDGGETWDLLESATVTAGVLSIADTTDAVMVGNYGTTSGQLAGKTYRARIYNNGTLAVDFDASRYAGGTTLTGSTGETWTLRGNAVIHPTNSPMLGYQAQGARTNLCTKSQEFDAWTGGSAGAGSNPVVTANAGTAPDGTATADKVVFSAPGAGDLSVITSPAFATVAASVYTSAVYVKAFAAGDVGKQLLTRQAGASGYTAITLSADWQRLGTTETAGGVSTTFDILLRPTFGGSSGTVSCYLWGAQVELGAFASSYIATTTVAVTRNADVLTYSSAGNIDGTKGWCYAEVNSYPFDTTMNHYVIADSTINRTPLYVNSSNAVANFDGTNNSIQTATAVNTGTVAKIASTFGGTTINSATKGTVGVATAFDGDFNFGANIEIGNTGVTAGAEYYGTIRNLRIGKRALSSSELGAITS